MIDPKIQELIAQEEQRQATTINLIASENYAPQAVLQATASVLTNKYAEGYPGKRYYAGCEIVDAVETLALQRCKELFGAEHVNVQPHAGSQANMAVYMAALNPGDLIMGMSLNEGGHLTHGHAVNFSGKIYRSVQYTVNRDTEMLDYEAIELMAQQHRPKLIIAGASAYSRIIDFERFAAIAQSVGALFMADIAHIAGLVTAELHPNPFPHADFVTSTTHKTLRGPRGGLAMCKTAYAQQLDRAIMPGMQGGPCMNVIAAKAVAFYLALQKDFKEYQNNIIKNAKVMSSAFTDLGYRIVSGGTDNHLFVIDLRSQGLTGLEAQTILAQAGITVSRSSIPFDTQKPWITSGIRIGTPAITTRGIQEDGALQIVAFVDEALKTNNNPGRIAALTNKVKELCTQYPL